MNSCEQFDAYLQGVLDEERFTRHRITCPECDAAWRADARLLSASSQLNNQSPVPELWPAIEAQLFAPQKRRRRLIYLSAAAMLIVFGALFVWQNRPLPAQPLLSAKAMQKAEKTEAAYLQAIREMESLAGPQMDSFPLELALLYRDKLETIDDQIDRCREALRQNPANTHIRRYMLAALSDKKETLAAVMQTEADEYQSPLSPGKQN